MSGNSRSMKEKRRLAGGAGAKLVKLVNAKSAKDRGRGRDEGRVSIKVQSLSDRNKRRTWRRQL